MSFQSNTLPWIWPFLGRGIPKLISRLKYLHEAKDFILHSFQKRQEALCLAVLTLTDRCLYQPPLNHATKTTKQSDSQRDKYRLPQRSAPEIRRRRRSKKRRKKKKNSRRRTIISDHSPRLNSLTPATWALQSVFYLPVIRSRIPRPLQGAWSRVLAETKIKIWKFAEKDCLGPSLRGGQVRRNSAILNLCCFHFKYSFHTANGILQTRVAILLKFWNTRDFARQTSTKMILFGGKRIRYRILLLLLLLFFFWITAWQAYVHLLFTRYNLVADFSFPLM